MAKPTIALQLYTVRDFANEDLVGTLQKVKDMGYNQVELAGMYDKTPEELKAVLDQVGLEAVSAHVGIGHFEADIKAGVAAYKTVGCTYIGVPWLDANQLPGGEKWADVKAQLQKIAAECKAQGITLMYHNHAHEFEKLPSGQYIQDAFFEELPEIEAEIDSGWVDAVNLCPAEYIKQYAGRVPVVHLKDTCKNAKTDKPVGQGTQDMPKITAAAVESGTKVFVAELDEAVGLTSLEAAQQSIEYLKSIGF